MSSSVQVTSRSQKILERLSTIPESNREAVEERVLAYLDWLADQDAGLARAEADIEAGRVKPLEEVASRLRAKYDL